MTKVAIVILNWNGIEFLKEFLPVLLKHTSMSGSEIIVADNMSTDASVAYLREKFPGIRLIELKENFGFAGGYNNALKEVEAEYYLLLNSDIEVTQNWLNPLLSFLDKNKDFAACSPMLLDYSNRDKYEYAGAAGGFIDKFGYTFCRGRLFNNTETADLTLTKPMEVFWTTGACMLVRAKVFRDAGGFDPYFFAHMEEVDLCWRIKNSGQKLAIVPESKVFHVGGGTLPKSNPFKTYLNFRNNLLLLYKNLNTSSLHKILFTRMAMDALSGIQFLFQFKFKDIAAILRAHKDFRRKKNDYIPFRAEQESKHSYPAHDEVYKKSLVLDYFLAGRHTFGKLRDDFQIKMNDKIIA